MPDEAEVLGLLALMLLQDSRRDARVGTGGELVLLEDQDRGLWDGAKIDEGLRMLEHALARRRSGPYQLQAAIAALHARAETPDDTDWEQIAALYGRLEELTGSPVVSLNRAVAVAMAQGPDVGLDAVDRLSGLDVVPPLPLDARRPPAPARAGGGSRGRVPACARAGDEPGRASLPGGAPRIARVTMTAPLRRVFVRRPGGVERWQEYGWRAAPDPVRIVEEHEAFVAALEAAGAEVVIGEPLDSALDAIYVHDPAAVTSRGAVLLRPGKELRRVEVDAIERDFVAAGIDVLARLEAPATAEGGDMLWLDEQTLVVGRGYRTNDAGVDALRAALHDVEVLRRGPPALPRPRRGDAHALAHLAARGRPRASSTCR